MLGWGGGRTKANSVCFTNSSVKIVAFPNATPTSKIWKNLPMDQKDQRRRSVWEGGGGVWVGQADFSIKRVSCVFF